MLPMFSRVRGYDNRYFNLLQDVLARIFDKMTVQPGLDAVLWENCVFESAYINKLQHGLGRVPRGFRVVRKDYETDVWEAQEMDINYVYLAVNTDVVLSVEVF